MPESVKDHFTPQSSYSAAAYTWGINISKAEKIKYRAATPLDHTSGSQQLDPLTSLPDTPTVRTPISHNFLMTFSTDFPKRVPQPLNFKSRLDPEILFFWNSKRILFFFYFLFLYFSCVFIISWSRDSVQIQEYWIQTRTIEPFLLRRVRGTLPFPYITRLVLALGASIKTLEGRESLMQESEWLLPLRKLSGEGHQVTSKTVVIFYFLTWMVTAWVFFSNYTHGLCTLPCVWYIFQFKKFPPKKVKWANILKPLIQWAVLFRYSLIVNYLILSSYLNPVLL